MTGGGGLGHRRHWSVLFGVLLLVVGKFVTVLLQFLVKGIVLLVGGVAVIGVGVRAPKCLQCWMVL